MIEVTSASPPLDEAGRLRSGPAASWGAIIAGAVVAISTSLVLLTLGAGLGFATVSPWPDHGASANGFGMPGIIWLIVTQWISAAIGGYIAGRMRQRWLATHTHEVFFRDTAHGLVTWSVATLFVSAVLVNSASAPIGGGAHALGGIATAGAHGASMMGEVHKGPMMGTETDGGGPHGAYDLDRLFRNSTASAPEGGARSNDAKMEAGHIAASLATNGSVSAEDRTYLANLVAAQTGTPSEEAQRRVDVFIQSSQDAVTKAKSAADKAGKVAATTALYTALALLIGAFIASVSAVIGGRLRDEHM